MQLSVLHNAIDFTAKFALPEFACKISQSNFHYFPFPQTMWSNSSQQGIRHETLPKTSLCCCSPNFQGQTLSSAIDFWSLIIDRQKMFMAQTTPNAILLSINDD